MIPILHLDLAASVSVPETHGESFFVFWWGGIPVGRLFGAGSRELREIVAAGVDQEALERAKQGAITKPTTALTASVVICTRDRPGPLEQCLASLSAQTLKPDQVIVVDNGSSGEQTRAVAMAAGATYLREDRLGLDIARNVGARHARGDVVAYTDDDVLLHKQWLERLVGSFDDPNIQCVTGLVLPAELRTEAQIYFERYWSFGRGFRRIDFDKAFFDAGRWYGPLVWTIGAGASMAVRRSAFASVGFFDERLDAGAAGCSGDSEFWHQILACGGICRYEPAAVAYHIHRASLQELQRQIYFYMRGHAAALLVQFEQTGQWRNLRRAIVKIPLRYCRRIGRSFFGASRDEDRFLWTEVRGYFAGLLYYLRQPRSLGRLGSRPARRRGAHWAFLSWRLPISTRIARRLATERPSDVGASTSGVRREKGKPSGASQGAELRAGDADPERRAVC